MLHNDRCYGFPKQKGTWSEARAHCNKIDIGYDLVVIDDAKENQFLQKQIEIRFSGEEFWIGLKENGTQDTYIWVDTTSLVFGNITGVEPWSKGEPNIVIKNNTYFNKTAL